MKADVTPLNSATCSNAEIMKSKALLVRLTRKKFNPNKLDKHLTESIQKEHGVTDKSAVRVKKSLVPKEHMKPMTQAISDASKYFYRVTTPWDDNGWRLLSVDLYTDFMTAFKKYTTTYRESAEGFIENFTTHVDSMRDVLGSAFNRSDYSEFVRSNGTVNEDALLAKFDLSVEYGTITSSDDIRASLTEEDRAVLAAHITEQNEKKFTKSQEHLVQLLFDAIVKINERLSGADQVFRDSLIGNLEDLCDIIPKMNIAGDPAINELANKARKALTKWDPQTLRDDDTKRKEVADSSKSILDGMKGMV